MFNPPYFRFFDGCLIPDFTDEYARLPLILAYLQPENNGFMHGPNFVSGVAGALIDNHAGFVANLHTQLQYFHNLEQHYKKRLGDTKSNYYKRPIVNDLSILHPYTHEQYVEMVIGNLTTVIKDDRLSIPRSQITLPNVRPVLFQYCNDD